MGKKVSRRDFARASMAAGAAAAAIPGVLLGKEPAAAPPAVGAAKAAGAAVAKKRRISMPPEVGYGGANSWGDGRDLLLAHTLTPAGQPTPSYPGGWKEGIAEAMAAAEMRLSDSGDRRGLNLCWTASPGVSRRDKPGSLGIWNVPPSASRT